MQDEFIRKLNSIIKNCADLEYEEIRRYIKDAPKDIVIDDTSKLTV